jgi:hypothetical protein
MNQPDPTTYVERILDLYRSARDTRGRCRTADRRLATTLEQRGVPITIVCAALILALARRRSRSPALDPLPAIASLHYFLPVIEELLHKPPAPDYIDYLRSRLGLPAVSAQPENHQVS